MPIGSSAVPSFAGSGHFVRAAGVVGSPVAMLVGTHPYYLAASAGQPVAVILPPADSSVGVGSRPAVMPVPTLAFVPRSYVAYFAVDY